MTTNCEYRRWARMQALGIALALCGAFVPTVGVQAQAKKAAADQPSSRRSGNPSTCLRISN